MDVEKFETISLYVGVFGLIAYCMFIMYRLAKDTQAGKFGTFIIFLTLGLGMFAVVVKEIVLLVMEH